MFAQLVANGGTGEVKYNHGKDDQVPRDHCNHRRGIVAA